MEMYAVEFYTKPENGMIKLPDEFAELKSELKVILMSDKHIKTLNEKSVKFQALSLKTKSFQFDREEANER